jgi:hypothetical protein
MVSISFSSEFISSSSPNKPSNENPKTTDFPVVEYFSREMYRIEVGIQWFGLKMVLGG